MSHPSVRLLISCVVFGAWGFGSAAAAPPGRDWVCTFAEEFDAPDLDPSRWATPPVVAAEAGLPGRFLLSDGALHLVLRPDGHRPWTSTRLSTRGFHQTFGYFEVRLRYARSTGLANVFGLSTDHPVTTGGLDIAVIEGTYPSGVAVHLRRLGRAASGARRILAGIDLSAEYHLYALEWRPDSRGLPNLVWYVDGSPVHRASCSECTQPMQLRLETVVTAWDGPFAPVRDGASMDVDYVRVYQLPRLLGRETTKPRHGATRK